MKNGNKTNKDLLKLSSPLSSFPIAKQQYTSWIQQWYSQVSLFCSNIHWLLIKKTMRTSGGWRITVELILQSQSRPFTRSLEKSIARATIARKNLSANSLTALTSLNRAPLRAHNLAWLLFRCIIFE